jgi:N-acetylglucosaminyldiphosphoundecaprenol N-acetyl-beta-D-mannosaminyltransferase
MGVPIHNITYEETLAWVKRWINEGECAKVISTINPEFLMQARVDSDFRAVLNRAALCVPDGVGILWAGRRHGVRLRERVAGSDLVPGLATQAARYGWRVFFLGAAPGVAEETSALLQQRNPGLLVAGSYAGSPVVEEEDEIVARIRASRADIVFVAYGAPKQNIWLDRNLARTGAVVGIGVGGAFDFITGRARRAPLWIQRIGLEWLHRLVYEPWRWRRQLVLPKFALLVLLGRDGGSRDSVTT